MPKIIEELTRTQKKALCIVLSKGYGEGKDGPVNIFMTDYKDWSTLDTAYTSALSSLGLDKFWDEEQKFFREGRKD
tara:strand:+ start:994 stop:1221 length:228 start_codon:yes stop_codon:yes gene_type:complete